MNPLLLEHFDRISEGPDAVARLRRFVLELAVRGRLVNQDPKDEPASNLLHKILAEKVRFEKARKVMDRESSRRASEVDVPFQLPESWTWARVGDAFHYDAGIKREPQELLPDRWLLELEDIEKDTSKVIARLRVRDRDSLSTKSEFTAGDILYGKLRPYLNKVVVATECGYSTTEIVAIRPFLPMCSEYCALAFRRPDFVDYVTRLGRGTKMPRLRTPDAVVALFPLPPLAEQHRIVARVDELMELCDRLDAAQTERDSRRIRLVKSSLHHLNSSATNDDLGVNARFYLSHLPCLTTRVGDVRELRQTILDLAVRGRLVPQNSSEESASELLIRIEAEKSRLVKAGALRKEKSLSIIAHDEVPFPIPRSWCWARIGTCSLLTEYGTSVKSDKVEHGVPVLAMGDIQGGQVILSERKKVPAQIEDLPDLYLKRFDLLYNRTNSPELVGKTGIYLGEDDAFTFASYLIRIQFLNHLTSSVYANIAMNAPFFRPTQIVPELRQQCGQANVNGSKLRNMMIPLPPFAEQQRIVAKVDELMAICDGLEAQLNIAQAESRRLLEAVLARAVNNDESRADEIKDTVQQRAPI
jgi:type I restriction enzyme, S subunit